MARRPHDDRPTTVDPREHVGHEVERFEEGLTLNRFKKPGAAKKDHVVEKVASAAAIPVKWECLGRMTEHKAHQEHVT